MGKLEVPNWRPREFVAASHEPIEVTQNATSSAGHSGRRNLPYVFTEHGAIMAANVLNSRRAVQMSVFVVRAFIENARIAR